MTNIDRGLLALSGLFFALIAVTMLVAPERFYATVPGVAASGPPNLHLLRDVGIAYGVIAIGLAAGIWNRNVARMATAGSALYLGGHAVLHAVMEIGARRPSVAIAEAPGVYLPAALMIVFAIRLARRRGRTARGSGAASPNA